MRKINGKYEIKTKDNYNADGTYQYGYEFEYDEQGRIGRITDYDKNKEREYYTVYEYPASPEDVAVGDVYERKVTTYVDDDRVLSYNVETYKAYESVE